MTTENHFLQGIPASPGIVMGRAWVLSDRGEVKGRFRLLFTEEEQAHERTGFKPPWTRPTRI